MPVAATATVGMGGGRKLSPDIVAAACRALAARRLPPFRQDRRVRVTDCRWSARKSRAVDRYDTLYRWISEMKATAPAAWDVLVSAGVRMNGRHVRLRGAPVHGARLAAVLREVRNVEAMETFTARTTAEALNRLASVVVSPGAWGSRLLGVQLDGTKAYFRRGRVRVALEPPTPSSSRAPLDIADVAGSSEGFAQVATLAVRQPDVIRAALWGVGPSAAGAREVARVAMASIASALRRDLPTGRALAVPSSFGAEMLSGHGVEDELAVLRGLVWPESAVFDLGRLESRVHELAQCRRSPLLPSTAWELAL